jgi:two-component system response regulator FlrC
MNMKEPRRIMRENLKSIMVVDDDERMRAALGEAVSRMGFRAILAEEPVQALKKLSPSSVSLIITDMKMPGMDGLSFIREARKKAGPMPVLVITGFATVENAVEVMKEGVCDYLIKPFSLKSLENTVRSIMSRESGSRNEILTCDDKIKELIKLASSVAASDITVLILGESGTGKELFARYIHNASRRCRKPFVAVNCAAIPDNLLESELFGYEKGAFTGAAEKKTGKFELANGGTILLDEIGEMSPTLQAKLLRVLQEKEIDRIGGSQPVPVDVRVLATTNRNLQREIIDGRFREDLYFRLSVFPLVLPPLRERPGDIKLLAEHFAARFAGELNKHIAGFSDEAMDFLLNNQWKGNIRELENVIHRAVLITRSDYIGTDDFMVTSDMTGSPASCSSIRDMEMELIMKTLRETGGNKTQAAKKLGVSVRTIRNKLNGYGKKIPAL